MEQNKYFLKFKNYTHKTIGEFIEILKDDALGIPLNELKIKDLTFVSEAGTLEDAHGVYIFKDKERIILVGKAETLSFTERIGKHFDIRPKAWFNRLLFVLAREKEVDRKNNEEIHNAYQEAWRYVFDNCSLILVKMEKTESIGAFERELIATAKPLNGFKTKKGDKNLKLESYE